MRGPSRAIRGWARLALEAGLLVLGLGLLQVVADRTDRRVDLTPTRLLSLSDVTRNVLRDVTAPLAITAFYRRGDRERHAELLRRLARENPNVTWELFDLDRFPERARSLGIAQYGRAAIEYQGRQVQAGALPEEQLAGGILRAVRGTARRVRFTSGHGERALAGSPASLGRLVASLGAENYVTESISLLDGAVPPGTDLLVVAGPQKDLLDGELRAIAAYLKDGGGVVLLLDPAALPRVSEFLASLGVHLGDDVVVDRERRILGTDGLAAVVELFRRGNPVSDAPAHPIESGVVLPSARTVDVEQETPGVDAQSIARTAPTAWAMADVERARRGEAPSEAHHDVEGSAPVMVIAEVGAAHADRGGRRGRLVVIGDSDLATDAYLDLLGNRDLVLNAIAWTVDEQALAGPRGGATPAVLRPLSPLVLTDPQVRAIGLLVAFGPSAAMLLVGAAALAAARW